MFQTPPPIKKYLIYFFSHFHYRITPRWTARKLDAERDGRLNVGLQAWLQASRSAAGQNSQKHHPSDASPLPGQGLELVVQGTGSIPTGDIAK